LNPAAVAASSNRKPSKSNAAQLVTRSMTAARRPRPTGSRAIRADKRACREVTTEPAGRFST
jgi:hypothetical protein